MLRWLKLKGKGGGNGARRQTDHQPNETCTSLFTHQNLHIYNQKEIDTVVSTIDKNPRRQDLGPRNKEDGVVEILRHTTLTPEDSQPKEQVLAVPQRNLANPQLKHMRLFPFHPRKFPDFGGHQCCGLCKPFCNNQQQ